MPFAGPPISGAIKVAVVPHPPGGSIDPVVADAVRAAADALADAGYAVTETCPPAYAEAAELWGRFLLGDFASILPQISAIMSADAMAFLNAVYAHTEPVTDAASMSHVLVARDMIAKAWSVFMAEYPLVLTPTWTQLPFAHGFDSAGGKNSAATIELMRPVVIANLLGLPSACVPAGRDEATGLPIGVLVNGRRFRDDLCLDAAEAIEARLGLQTPIDPVA